MPLLRHGVNQGKGHFSSLDFWPALGHYVASMTYRIILSPQASADFHGLCAYDRAKVRDAIDDYLQYAPTAESKSRIKRLRDLRKPQYRLRVDDLRVFYDVDRDVVMVHGIVEKTHAEDWLAETGERT